MNKLSFEHYLNIKEMATGQFNWQKKPIGHINDWDKVKINWVLEKMFTDANFARDRKFKADDGSDLSPEQVIAALKIRQQGGKVAPTSSREPIKAISATSARITPTEPVPTDPAKGPEQQSLDSKKGAKDPSEYMISADKISEYQKSIEDSFSSSNKHLVINALAGTGKTTILKHLAAKFSVGKKWLYIVFNKTNAAEATSGDKAFPPSVESMTSHKFLARVLADTRKERPGVLPKSNARQNNDDDEGQDRGSKLSKILDGNWFFRAAKSIQDRSDFPGRGFPSAYQFIRWNNKKSQEEVAWVLKKKVEKLAGLAKNFAINPSSPDAKQKIEEIMKKYKIDGSLSLKQPGDDDDDDFVGDRLPDFTKQFVDITIQILNATAPHGSAGDANLDTTQDYDDIIWWPTLHPDKVVWPNSSKYSVALVDEVQDFNEAQKVMLENLAKNGVRIIVVGDPNQAIYRFRGADAKGFSNIQALLGGSSRGASSHDLPVNYRNGKKIIDYVNQNTHMKNLPVQLKAGRDHDGEVNPDAKYDEVMSGIDKEWSEGGQLKQETAFISRNNAPLLGTALKLLKKHIPFTIIGKDFSNEVLNFVYRILGNDKIGYGKVNAPKTPIEGFENTMKSYVLSKEDKYENKKDKEKYLDELYEMYQAMASLLKYVKENEYKNPLTNSKMNTIKDLCDYIYQIFKGLDPQDKDAETYKKIDKKKNVILTTAHKSKGLEFERVNIVDDDLFPPGGDYDPEDEEAQQEHNAKYVAYTRAIHTLNITRSDGVKGKTTKRLSKQLDSDSY